MDTSQPLESLTLLTTTTQGRCDCGCGCDAGFFLTRLRPPQPSEDHDPIMIAIREMPGPEE
jgi:hypothetical protein